MGLNNFETGFLSRYRQLAADYWQLIDSRLRLATGDWLEFQTVSDVFLISESVVK